MWNDLKLQLIKILKRGAVKVALRKFLITSNLGTWIVTYIVEEIFDDYGTPIINKALRNIGYAADKIEGSLIIRKLNNAQDQSDYDSIVDDIHRM